MANGSDPARVVTDDARGDEHPSFGWRDADLFRLLTAAAIALIGHHEHNAASEISDAIGRIRNARKEALEAHQEAEAARERQRSSEAVHGEAAS